MAPEEELVEQGNGTISLSGPSVPQCINEIRTKVYGRDIRSAIANGLEGVYRYKANMEAFGVYDPTSQYAVDDYCYYQEEGHDWRFYRCIVDIKSPGEVFNPEHWTPVTLAGELSAFKNATYEEITIKTFAVDNATAEMGSTVTYAGLTYTLSKTPQMVKLDGSDTGSPYYTNGHLEAHGTWTTAKTFTLLVIDERGTEATKTAKLNFYNNIIWGVAELPSTVNSAFIMGLSNKTLSGTKGRTISVNAGANQRIFYALPKRLGTCTFTVGGFAGGFSTRLTVSVTNSSGYSEDYYVYYSDNTGLGSTSVVVS